MVNIRIMTASDYDGVYALWLRIAGMGLNEIDDSQEGIGKYLIRNPGTSFIAEDGGELVGAVMCGHDGRRGMIYHMAVDEKYRNRGIAAALLDAAIGALRREGIAKVMLLVKADNALGNAFWERRGFTTRDDVVFRSKVLLNCGK